MFPHVSASDLSYEQYFNSLIKVEKIDFNLNDYQYIPTVKHRLKIQSACDQLPELCGFDKFVVVIIYGKQKAWLSNTYNDIAIPYHVHQLYYLDTSISEKNYAHKDHFFPTYDLTHPVDLLYRKLIQEMYHFYNLYILVRECFEATILIYAGSSKPIAESLQAIYARTYRALENFAINFLDDHIEILAENSSNIKHLCLYQDKNYRKNIIHRKCIEHVENLTCQEVACLHWAGYGKTAAETALIMKISPHTVRQHLKVAIEKLNATNVTHAVFKARNNDFI